MKTLQILVILITIGFIFACSEQEQKQEEKPIVQKAVDINLDALPKLKYIVESIEKGNRLESAHIGAAGAPSDAWTKYEQLKKVANIEQLVTLTDHKNPAVRCYAFKALAAKQSNKVFPILLKHLRDTANVHTLSGCIGMNQYTGDYFVDVVTPNYIERDIYKLNDTEKMVLDSILFNDKSVLITAKFLVMETLKPTENNYPRSRQLVKEERNVSALITLAKYQKQTDKELIASFFKDDGTQSNALYAVREFPDPYFYSYVKKIFEQEWKKELYDYPKWRTCYQALARYPKPETIDLFTRTIQCQDEFRNETLSKYLLMAIIKYPNKLYDPLKAQIKLDSYAMEEVKSELEASN